MEDIDVLGFLPVPVHAAIALLHAVRVPGNLDMDQLGAMVLQVYTLGSGIGRQQDADGGFLGMGLERGLDRFALVVGHPAVDHHQAPLGGEAFPRQQVMQPLLGGAVFREEDDPLFVPLPARLQFALQPVDQGLRLAVGAQAGLLGVPG